MSAHRVARRVVRDMQPSATTAPPAQRTRTTMYTRAPNEPCHTGAFSPSVRGALPEALIYLSNLQRGQGWDIGGIFHAFKCGH